MPIVISRTGSVEPVQTSPLTQEQKQALWEHIVLAYCQKHPEQLRSAMEQEVEVPA